MCFLTASSAFGKLSFMYRRQIGGVVSILIEIQNALNQAPLSAVYSELQKSLLSAFEALLSHKAPSPVLLQLSHSGASSASPQPSG